MAEKISIEPTDSMSHEREDHWSPEPPDPGPDMTRLIAWIKKRGLHWPLKKCQTKWQQLGHHEDLEDVIRKMNRNDLITIGRYGNDIVHVRVVNRKWADNWASYRGMELPHHSDEVRTDRDRKRLLYK